MSKVVAYLEIASKRVVDSIAIAIRTWVLNDFGEELKKSLEKNLNLTAERSARFALDDSNIRRARREYETLKIVLLDVLRELRKLEETDDIAKMQP
jgi:hypothetical protein